MKKPNQQIDSVFTPLVQIGGYVAGIAAILIMLLTVVDIILRAFFNLPILGGMEMAENLMLVLCIFAIPYCALHRRHVKVDILVMRYKPRTQEFFQVFGCVLSLAVLIPLTIIYIPESIDVLKNREISEILSIPVFPFYVIVFIGFLFSTIMVIGELLLSIQKIRKNEYES